MINNSISDFADISENSNSVSISSKWIEENFSEVIILKDFNTELIESFPTRELPNKILSHFDLSLLKEDIFMPNKEAKTKAEEILSVLLNSNVRRGGLTKIEPFLPIFLRKIKYFTNNNLPVHLIIPSLPHKKQNPITTGHSLDFIDLGEYLCMLQLKNIISSIKKVYIHGAKITILSDGILLAHLFARNDLRGVHNYFKKLHTVQDDLRLKNDIIIKDLNDLILAKPDFDKLKIEIKEQLYALIKVNPLIAEGMMILQKAMLFNIPFNHSLQEHMEIIKIPFQNMPQEIREEMKLTAFEYASILLAMRKLELIKNAFPHSLRASVHNKATPNIPLNLINESTLIFPYNGIPVVRTNKFKRTNNIRKSTRIMRLYEIYKYPSATAVYLKGQKEPFWYEIDSLSEIT